MAVAQTNISDKALIIEGYPLSFSAEEKKQIDAKLKIARQQVADGLTIPASQEHLQSLIDRAKKRCKL